MNDNKNIAAEIQKELDNLSPTLAEIPRKHPYSVTEDYFSSAGVEAAKMAVELGIQKKTAIVRIVSTRNLSIAASIILLAILGWLINIPTEGQEQYASSEASIDEMITYLEYENSMEIEEYELIEELIDLNADIALSDIPEEDGLTTEDLIDYLLDDNIDLATIVDELQDI